MTSGRAPNPRESVKLLVAYEIFGGDRERIARYMGLKTSVVYDRYRKLITDEKKKAEALGFSTVQADGRPKVATGRQAKKNQDSESELEVED